jgi:tRNA threonylcarbamoyladenosine modification (KEOPS) complex  Pcc1 subunit
VNRALTEFAGVDLHKRGARVSTDNPATEGELPVAISEAKAVEEKYSGRDLARYQRWQHRVRPEDTGYSDGLAGLPVTAQEVSQFDCKIRDDLNSRLGVVRNQFAASDAVFATELVTLEADYKYYQSLLAEKRKIDSRPVVIRLEQRPGLIAIAIATLLAASLMGVLWIDKGLNPMVGVLIAILETSIASMVAYPCGIALRQGTQSWHKWLAVAVLAVLVGGELAVALNMRVPSFDVAERAAMGTLIALAAIAVAAAAFMMHDQDPVYPGIVKKHRELHKKASTLEIARAENRVFHTNNGRRHVEIARQMISAYRDANNRGRVDKQLPKSWSEDSPMPRFVEIADDWLCYLEVRQK